MHPSPGPASLGPLVAGWTPPPPPEPVVLTGRTVQVRPLTSAHFADLYAAACGPEDDDLWTFRPVDRPRDLAGLWMHLSGVAERDPSFVLVPEAGAGAGAGPGKAAGWASYLRADPANGVVEIGGIVLGRSLQRTVAATEAIHLLVRHAFDEGYRRVEWKCDSRNEASRRAAARLGFTYEGRFRRHLVVKGHNRDTDWFAIVDEDWPAVRAAHERWLDPANFDADGRQRVSLRDLTRG